MKELAPEERRVMFGGGTEVPFTGKYVDTHESGNATVLTRFV